MGKSRIVRETINGDILREEFKKRGVTLSDASIKIGYDASYLSKSIRAGMMPKSSMLLIQAMYNIAPDSYHVKDEPIDVETSVVEVVHHTGLTDEDLEKLYKVIYSAVYKATKRALEE